jgi:Transcriptional regulator, AbiEi antitoxin
MPNENHTMCRIRSVAARQWGCITVAQLLAAGLTRRQVEHMARRGLLIRVHGGVRSRLEARAPRQLGMPEVNGRVGGDEVDLRWGSLVVELDHDQTHGTKWARERDARKDQRLEERGFEVRRFTV